VTDRELADYVNLQIAHRHNDWMRRLGRRASFERNAAKAQPTSRTGETKLSCFRNGPRIIRA
jgi:hypothetical protein